LETFQYGVWPSNITLCNRIKEGQLCFFKPLPNVYVVYSYMGGKLTESLAWDVVIK